MSPVPLKESVSPVPLKNRCPLSPYNQVVSSVTDKNIVVFKPESIGGLVQLPDGSVYEGEYKNGMFHGDGKLIWSNGDVYTGEFKDGLKHGKGKDQLAAGSVYEGEYVKGYWAGQGELKYKNGDSYKGDFKQGSFDGQGNFVSQDGIIYEGEFRLSKMNGKGKITYIGGATYEGEVKDWMMHGEGVYTTTKNDVYTGEFFKNKQYGKGEIRFKEGDHYTGEIKNWRAHGKGVMKYKNGNQYTGEFDNNLFHGEGTMEYKNGNQYIGQYKNGSQHGKGTLTRANPKGHKKVQKGWWEYSLYIGEKEPVKDKSGKLSGDKKKEREIDAEAIFYRQPVLLKKALAKLKAERSGKPDMYFLGFAGYGSQDVFMKETRYAKNMFDKDLETKGRSFALVNNHKVAKKIPLASVTNLNRSLKHLADVMDVEQDILFLYLTSHGSDKHELDVSLRGLPLNDLPAKRLAKLIKESGIKWKVIVISSCYSGGFIKELKDDKTLIMTSASADHVSFGCSDESEFTFFGEALLKDSIPFTGSFIEAFKKASTLVTAREVKEKYDHSEPQLWTAKKIEAHLLTWRKSLTTKVATAGR